MEKKAVATQIWKEHSGALKNFICIKVNGEEHCNDILHDVFLKMMEHEDRIALVEKPSAYLIKMAQNAVYDYYRGEAKKSKVESSGEEYEAPNLTSHQLADCCLLPFIQRLPPIYGEALILTELEGLSQRALAERLEISFSGAKSRVQRGRQMLKEAILACCPYEFDKYGNIIGCCEK